MARATGCAIGLTPEEDHGLFRPTKRTRRALRQRSDHRYSPARPLDPADARPHHPVPRAGRRLWAGGLGYGLITQNDQLRAKELPGFTVYH